MKSRRQKMVGWVCLQDRCQLENVSLRQKKLSDAHSANLMLLCSSSVKEKETHKASANQLLSMGYLSNLQQEWNMLGKPSRS